MKYVVGTRDRADYFMEYFDDLDSAIEYAIKDSKENPHYIIDVLGVENVEEFEETLEADACYGTYVKGEKVE